MPLLGLTSRTSEWELRVCLDGDRAREGGGRVNRKGAKASPGNRRIREEE